MKTYVKAWYHAPCDTRFVRGEVPSLSACQETHTLVRASGYQGRMTETEKERERERERERGGV